jgi:predicted small secreted protein
MVMKKVLGAVAITAMSAMLLAGCESMSANEQRIGAAA